MTKKNDDDKILKFTPKEDKPEEKTEEQMEKEYQEEMQRQKKEWDDFEKDLTDNPDEPVTKKDLKKAVDFIAGDMASFGNITGMNMKNIQILQHNLQQVINILQGGGPSGPNRTSSGIIMP